MREDEFYYVRQPFRLKNGTRKKGENPFRGSSRNRLFLDRPKGSKGVDVDLNVGEQCRSTEPTKKSDSDAVSGVHVVVPSTSPAYNVLTAQKCQLNTGNRGEYAF